MQTGVGWRWYLAASTLCSEQCFHAGRAQHYHFAERIENQPASALSSLEVHQRRAGLRVIVARPCFQKAAVAVVHAERHRNNRNREAKYQAPASQEGRGCSGSRYSAGDPCGNRNVCKIYLIGSAYVQVFNARTKRDNGSERRTQCFPFLRNACRKRNGSRPWIWWYENTVAHADSVAYETREMNATRSEPRACD
ncbi:hypothetical protein CALVIDRAFT_417133 [Calocera viscosa TUFC12733]|uniref:Uncharacterized protein n=1 Tax=Calocera viscosa (strain TUFC12733) TaxID=1330018 RepID=A0A167PFZ1_CALVF|nr:hypothetical protein CALVIDRAFT_417133 [Calocera viscosa TUFC12733]